MENNIIDFEGMVQSKQGLWSKPEHYFKKGGEEYSEKWHTDLKYHTSWDWLMPVVEKIQSIDITPVPNYTGYRIEIVVQGYVKITGFPMPPITTNVSMAGSLINAVWLAVVQFIQWYNLNSLLNVGTERRNRRLIRVIPLAKKNT